MRADIHDGQEHKRSIHGPDTEAQDQSSPSVTFGLQHTSEGCLLFPGKRKSKLASGTSENDPSLTNRYVRSLSALEVSAQPVDATQALNLSAGVSNVKVLRGRSLS